MTQFDLFGAADSSAAPVLPSGFRYRPDLIDRSQEAALLEHIRRLPFSPFEFHGYTGKRRTVSFGWNYDFTSEQLQLGAEMPDFLRALRVPVAAFAGLEPQALPHVLVTEYEAGAGIGWHRDKGVFDRIVGVSLLASCTFRLRRAHGTGWERVNVTAEARSAYILSGESRTRWEHSIPPVDALRYSVTFRSMRPR